MSGRRALGNINFKVNGSASPAFLNRKYLGVWLDQKRCFQAHVEEAAKKSAKVWEVLVD